MDLLGKLNPFAVADELPAGLTATDAQEYPPTADGVDHAELPFATEDKIPDEQPQQA